MFVPKKLGISSPLGGCSMQDIAAASWQSRPTPQSSSGLRQLPYGLPTCCYTLKNQQASKNDSKCAEISWTLKVSLNDPELYAIIQQIENQGYGDSLVFLW